MAERKITITFLGDSKGAVTAVGDVSQAVGGLGSTIGDITKTAAGFALGAAFTKAPGVLMSLNDQAKNLELQAKKIQTVFGDQAPRVAEWAEESAGALGLTTREASNLAANMADLLIPMGFQRDVATDLATKTIGLAGALSEWSGGAKSSAEVSDILTKAYLGETDGLKALGISISAADITARLAAKGQEKLTGAALEQAQALAVQELVFEKSTDAQTAFANGADSNARKQAAASARIRELKEDIALGLQPAFIAVTALIADKVIPIVTDLAEKAIPKITAAAEQVGPVLAQVGAIIRDQILPPLQMALEWFTGNADAMAAAAGALGAILVAVFLSWAAAAGAAAVATIAAAAPVIAIIAVIALLGAGIVLLVKHWDDLTAKYPQLAAASEAVRAAFNAFVSWIRSDLVPTIQSIAETVTKVSTDVVNVVTTVWSKVKPIVEGYIAAWKVVIETGFNQIRVVIETILGVIKGLVDVFMGVFTGDWDRAWSGVKQIVSAAWAGIQGSVENGIALVKGLAPLMLDAGKAIGGALLDGLLAGLNATQDFATNVAGQLLAALKSAVNAGIIDPLNRGLEFHVGGSILGKSWGVNIDPPDIPHLALGGMASGRVRVGEFGAETVILPHGSRVIADGGRGAGGDINFNAPVTIHAETRERALLAAGDFAFGVRGRLRRTGGL